ncbi:Histidine kinase [Rhodovastum atsumiense]|nr:PAS domain S-box protein [Rhodovastum atsumiense]CAH2600404.1 Histidine kinase [Rhodovastum atsumiense]
MTPAPVPSRADAPGQHDHAATAGKALEAMTAQEETFSSNFELDDVGKLQADAATGRILRVNAAFARTLGHPPEAMIGRSAWDFTHIDDRATHQTGLASLLAGEIQVFLRELRQLRHDGTPVWVRASATLARDPTTGMPQWILGTIEDIDARRQAETTLAENEARLRLAMEAADLGVWEFDFERMTGRLDLRGAAMTGGIFPEKEWIAFDDPRLAAFAANVHPEDRKRHEALRHSLLQGTGDRLGAEFRMRRPDGGWSWISVSGAVVERAPTTGAPRRAVTIVQDVTARIEAEATLRGYAGLLEREVDEHTRRLADRDARLRAIFEAQFQFIGLLAPDGTLLEANAAALAFIGRRAEDVVGRPFWETEWWTGDPAQQSRLREAVRRAAAGSFIRYEVILAGADGQEAVFDFSLKPVRDRTTGAVTLLIPEGRALSDLRAMERRVAKSEARLRRMIEHLPETITVARAGVDGFVLEFVNAAAERLLGRPRAELISRRFAELFAPTLAQEAEAHARACLHSRAPVRYEATRDYAGSHVEMDIVVVPLDDADSAEPLVLFSARDVTAARRMQERLVHGERMQALGQLAGGMAHDFNGILQTIAGAASLMERSTGDPARLQRLVRMISEAAERGSAVTSRLLAFSRRGEIAAGQVDVAAVLQSLQDVLRHTLGRQIALQVDTPGGLPMLRTDKGQLEVVLVNLAANARDAMPEGGTLTLTASAGSIAPGDAMLAPGPYLRIAVTDTGHGMDATTLARATEPFFTTKPEDKGTGLGLSMAREFAEQQGGVLRLESALGHGTSVTLWLPCGETTGEVPTACESAGTVTARAGRVLLVDNDPLTLETLAIALESAEYEVTLATSGPAALERLGVSGNVDVLITDLAMPGMDGLALIQAARQRDPGLPAVLLSDYAGASLRRAVRTAGDGTILVLRKPVPANRLCDAVAVLLPGRAPMPEHPS